jgi:hypothetical protein
MIHSNPSGSIAPAQRNTVRSPWRRSFLFATWEGGGNIAAMKCLLEDPSFTLAATKLGSAIASEAKADRGTALLIELAAETIPSEAALLKQIQALPVAAGAC